MSKLTDRAADDGDGGVRLSTDPLFTGEELPLTGWRTGDDCAGDSGRDCPKRAPSGESGVLHLSFGSAETKV